MASNPRQNPVARGTGRAPVATTSPAKKVKGPTTTQGASMAAADSASAVARKKYYADQAAQRSAAKSQPPKSLNPFTKLVSALRGGK